MAGEPTLCPEEAKHKAEADALMAECVALMKDSFAEKDVAKAFALMGEASLLSLRAVRAAACAKAARDAWRREHDPSLS